MSDELRERAWQFDSTKLRQDLYTALDQWHRGGTGPQLEAVLPIITAIRGEAMALMLEEAAQHKADDYNGGDYDWACNCGERGHYLTKSGNEAPDSWPKHIRSLHPSLAAVREHIVSEAALNASSATVDEFVTAVKKMFPSFVPKNQWTQTWPPDVVLDALRERIFEEALEVQLSFAAEQLTKALTEGGEFAVNSPLAKVKAVVACIVAQARLDEVQDIQRTSCLAWDDTMDRFLEKRLVQLEAEMGGGK
jgi:hypothetical protein